MKIVGKAKLVFRDVNTGEITREMEATNNITEWWYSAMSNWYTGDNTVASGRFGHNIFVSSYDGFTETNRWEYNISKVEAIGYEEAGVTSPTFNYGNPYHWQQWQQRFDPPGTDRTINIIGITDSETNTSDYTNYGMVRAMAWVYLTSPCTQLTTETLDIFYRVQWFFDADWGQPTNTPDSTQFNYREATSFAQRAFYGNYPNPTIDAYNMSYSQKFNPRRWNYGTGRDPRDTITEGDETLISFNTISDLRKGRINFNLGLNDKIGTVIGSVMWGEDYYPSRYSSSPVVLGRTLFEGEAVSPVQNIFGHSATATKPFYDSVQSNTGDGTMVVDGSAWTNPDYPKMYRIDVTSTGGVSGSPVGEYKFMVRDHFGFHLNTYSNYARQLYGWNWASAQYTDGFRVTWNEGANGAVPESYKVSTIVPVDKETVVMGHLNEDQICIANVSSQEGKRFYVDSTPALPATKIGQFEPDASGNIWVACRNTGAYRISQDQTTVTTFDSSTPGLAGVGGCKAICPGVGSRVWAFFAAGGGSPSNKGLYYTDDQGASWTQATFSETDINSDADRVIAIKTDKAHADHRLAVLKYTHSSDDYLLDIVWWDLTSSTTAAGPRTHSVRWSNPDDDSGRWAQGTYPVTYFNCFDCSPTQGFWATSSRRTYYSDTAYPARYTFGTTGVSENTVRRTYSPYATAFDIDEDGNEALLYIGYINSNTMEPALIKQNGTRQEWSPSDALSYADDGFMFGQNLQCYLGDGNFIGMKRRTDSGSYTDWYQELRIMNVAPNSPQGGVAQAVFWREYGWDGANWVKDNPNSKPFHAAAEELEDGVTIAFDDDGGTQSFTATDYYTFGVVDGVWLDGSTTLHHHVESYYKPTIPNSTDLNVAAVPSGTIEPSYRTWISSFTWQDELNINGDGDTRYRSTNSASWDSGSRSTTVAVRGANATHPDFDAWMGYIQWRPVLYQGNFQTNPGGKYVVGLSSASVLGTGIDPDTVEFGIRLQCPVGSYISTVEIIHSGTVVHTYGTIDINDDYTNQVFRILIKNDGSIQYDWYSKRSGRVIMYTAPPGTAAVQDYHLDMAFWGYTSVGIESIRSSPRVPADNYIYVGDGASTGRWLPDGKFFAFDYHYTTVTIDGTPATNIGNNNFAAALTAGQVSYFPNYGMIRLSPADATKSITADYTLITHE